MQLFNKVNESVANFKTTRFGNFLSSKKNMKIVLASMGVFLLVVVVFIIVYKITYELRNPIFLEKD